MCQHGKNPNSQPQNNFWKRLVAWSLKIECRQGKIATGVSLAISIQEVWGRATKSGKLGDVGNRLSLTELDVEPVEKG